MARAIAAIPQGEYRFEDAMDDDRGRRRGHPDSRNDSYRRRSRDN